MRAECIKCKFHNKENWATCDAFPKGIPYEIISGEFDHKNKHPEQDNDIVFEPIENEQ